METSMRSHYLLRFLGLSALVDVPGLGAPVPAASAAAGAAGTAACDYASAIRTKDEMTLSYRLESTAGKVLVEKAWMSSECCPGIPLARGLALVP
jgi:hypothetical protein